MSSLGSVCLAVVTDSNAMLKSGHFSAAAPRDDETACPIAPPDQPREQAATARVPGKYWRRALIKLSLKDLLTGRG